jgi:hypothetical protein
MGTINYNALGQAIDTSWGRSSTPLNTTTSIKMQLVGDGLMKVMYLTPVTFRNDRELAEFKPRCESDAVTLINMALKNVRATYKKLTGKSLRTTQESYDDSIEVVNLAVHNPTRQALFRRIALISLN